MKRGDKVRIVHRDGTVEMGHVSMAGTALVHVRHDDGSLSHHSPRALEAMRSVLDAAEAVTRARDAVVDAAKRQFEMPPSVASHIDDETLADDAWHERLARCEAVDDAVAALYDAERAEAEARAALEALQ